MIDPKELRIGAHISINGERVSVEQIASDYIGLKHKEGDYSGYPPDRDRIEPIPITAELLHQIGFEDKIDCGIKIFQKEFGDYAVRFIYDGCNLWRCNCYTDNNLVCRVGMVRRISYLHQAEQMLSVYGIELIKE